MPGSRFAQQNPPLLAGRGGPGIGGPPGRGIGLPPGRGRGLGPGRGGPPNGLGGQAGRGLQLPGQLAGRGQLPASLSGAAAKWTGGQANLLALAAAQGTSFARGGVPTQNGLGNQLAAAAMRPAYSEPDNRLATINNSLNNQARQPGFPNLGRGLPNLGRGLPNLGRGLPNLGRGLPNLGRGLNPGNFGALPGMPGPGFRGPQPLKPPALPRSLKADEYEVVFNDKPYSFGIRSDSNGANGIVANVNPGCAGKVQGLEPDSMILYINGSPMEGIIHEELVKALKTAVFPCRIVLRRPRPQSLLLPKAKRMSTTMPSGGPPPPPPAPFSTPALPPPQDDRPTGQNDSGMHELEGTLADLFGAAGSENQSQGGPSIGGGDTPPISPIDNSGNSPSSAFKNHGQIQSPSLSPLTDDDPSPVKKKEKKSKTGKSKKKKAKKTTSDSKIKNEIVKAVKSALKQHNLAREDFKNIAKKASGNLCDNYKKKNSKKGKKTDPRHWVKKRKRKIEQLVAKYIKKIKR